MDLPCTNITGVYLGNVKIIVALRAILINNFQFVDQKQNTVPYIAVMCFGA